jgi:hypothetical protein
VIILYLIFQTWKIFFSKILYSASNTRPYLMARCTAPTLMERDRMAGSLGKALRPHSLPPIFCQGNHMWARIEIGIQISKIFDSHIRSNMSPSFKNNTRCISFMCQNQVSYTRKMSSVNISKIIFNNVKKREINILLHTSIDRYEGLKRFTNNLNEIFNNASSTLTETLTGEHS